MTTLHTTLTDSDIERAQMADEYVVIPNPGGSWMAGDVLDLVTPEGTEFGGCYVAYSEPSTAPNILVGVS